MAQVEKYYLPDDQYYDRKDHLWARREESVVRVGVDMFGQAAAGAVVYIKLLPEGRPVTKGRSFGSLEAGKYIGPLRAPVGGRILRVNQEVLQNPGLVNSDPYGAGWFVVIEPSNLEEDLSDLVHGDQVQPWLESEVREYREKGLLRED